MFSIGKKLAAYLKEEPDVIVDSTPLEASRYSGCSVLNPHSGIVMDKAHILHYGNYPLFLIHSEGNENDKPYGEDLLEVAARMGIRPDSVLMDAGYDSFRLHALSYELLGATPMIQVRYDAVFAPEASEEAIRRKVNKLWKIGGNECRTLEEMLRSLLKHGYRELVGKYLRNQSLLNREEVQAAQGRREACERKHAHLKNTVKFDVRGYRKDSRALYVMMNFLTFQLMTLAHFQNNFPNTTSFAGYR
jgi:hypothetical protein